MQGVPAPTRGLRFVGSYLFQMDEKGRVALPAAFRRTSGNGKESAEQRFVLIQAYAPSLALYPEAEWAGVEERLTELVRHQPEARMYVLKVISSAVELTPDAQGRILVPARLQEVAELEGQVLLIGAIDKVEIWNPRLFDAAVKESTAGFERFAPQIFH
jgi:MraZ protein